jgi:hypothetical protein
MNKNPPELPEFETDTILFKPLTDGLGFHPFSDGLPYAPIGKNPKTNMAKGTGAVAAGPVKTALPAAPAAKGPARSLKKAVESSTPNLYQAPRVSVPVAKPVLKPTVIPNIQKESGVSALKSKLESQIKTQKKSTKGLAYLGARLMAYLFDVSFNSLLLGGGLFGLVWSEQIRVEQVFEMGLPLTLSVFFLITAWGFIALQEILFKSSIGKFLFHFKLEGSRFWILFRGLMFPLSMGFAGVGIIWTFFHGSRSCWHDILSGVQPSYYDRS